MAGYWEKLKDPRWQRKRLAVFQRAGFECEECGANDKQLHAHHKLYRKNADPWDYQDDELACLCDECHSKAHDLRTRLNEALARLTSLELEFVIGYATACACLSSPHNPCRVGTAEEAMGVGDAFGLTGEEVIAALNDGLIDGFTLWKLKEAKKKASKG
jgi:hypothetical protein